MLKVLCAQRDRFRDKAHQLDLQLAQVNLHPLSCHKPETVGSPAGPKHQTLGPSAGPAAHVHPLSCPESGILHPVMRILAALLMQD